MAGSERSSYIRKALRFYFRFGKELKVISKGVKDISTKIDNVGFKSIVDIAEEEPKMADMNESEEILLESMQDLLGL